MQEIRCVKTGLDMRLGVLCVIMPQAGAPDFCKRSGLNC